MVEIFLFCFVWIICSILSYILLKRDLLRALAGYNHIWSVGDRRGCLAFSFGLGPVMLVVGLFLEVIHFIVRHLGDPKNPAKW